VRVLPSPGQSVDRSYDARNILSKAYERIIFLLIFPQIGQIYKA
jgi:hypothetical protein